MIAILFIGAVVGACGGVLKSVVMGSMGTRLVVAGCVGGMFAAACLATPTGVVVERFDVVLLMLYGYVAADLFEALTKKGR